MWRVAAVADASQVWDLRTQQILYTLRGHTDTVCPPPPRSPRLRARTPTYTPQIASLSLSPSTHYLASYALDSTLIIYDVRPFASDPSRVHRSLAGAPAGFEQTLVRCAWSRHDGGQHVGAGGGDRTVTVWQVESGQVRYKLPGHRGTVTGVDFHPR